MDDSYWTWPDRRDMYVACLALADPAISAERIAEATDTLLNDLELYDDPRQGHEQWLFPNEVAIADDLATKLHLVVHDKPVADWGHVLLADSLWHGICSDAEQLLHAIRRNGRGSPRLVR